MKPNIKDEIKKLEDQIKFNHAEIYRLKNSCVHEVIIDNGSRQRAICNLCGEIFGDHCTSGLSIACLYSPNIECARTIEEFWDMEHEAKCVYCNRKYVRS